MNPERRFELIYSPIFKQHLKSIDRNYYSTIRAAIEAYLIVNPDLETRNRKPLKRPVAFGATWEIRCGANNRFRIFYEVDRENYRVTIIAVAEKKGNRLIIGGVEVDL